LRLSKQRARGAVVAGVAEVVAGAEEVEEVEEAEEAGEAEVAGVEISLLRRRNIL